MLIILDVTRMLLTIKQREGESLQDYRKNLLKCNIGEPIILNKFVKGMDGYDEMDTKLQDKFCEQAFSQFLVYLYLDNVDKTKYGSNLTGLSTQQFLGNDQ